MPENTLTPVSAQIRAEFRPKAMDFTAFEVGLDALYAANLRQCRLAIGVGQDVLARDLGISLSQYRRYESGRDYMRMGTTARYMMHTGIPFQYFFLGGPYDYLFSSLTIRLDLLRVQMFVGQQNDRVFTALITLLSELMDIALPPPPSEDGLYWPSQDEVAAELPGYYLMVSNGLRHFREVLALSQEDLAELLCIAPSTLGSYEKAKNEPHFNVIMALRLWAATGVNPVWLTYGSHFFNMRRLQHRRMEYLCQLLHASPVPMLPLLIRAIDALTEFRVESGRSR